MSKISYMLHHDKRGCKLEFSPNQKPLRLLPEAAHAEALKYQDLLIGQCPHCKVEVMGWIGIDYLEEPINYTGISERKHADWLSRIDTDLVRPHDPKAASSVTGSVLDMFSDKWRFKSNIPVR